MKFALGDGKVGDVEPLLPKFWALAKGHLPNWLVSSATPSVYYSLSRSSLDYEVYHNIMCKTSAF
jgi:hypothetical protein